jgi:superoxide dismutase, Fe-Mn family
MTTATAKAPSRLHFKLPPLPYAEDALEPVISAETLSFHHGKHHKKYIDTMNELLTKSEVRGTTLEDVVRSSEGKLFNNAAQAWNHDFYWRSLSPKSGDPSGAMRQRLERDFGSYQSFRDKFAAAADAQFGSGWAWLIDRNGKLEVLATADADTPMPASARRLGARLLSRLPQPAREVRAGGDREAAELGVRRAEPKPSLAACGDRNPASRSATRLRCARRRVRRWRAMPRQRSARYRDGLPARRSCGRRATRPDAPGWPRGASRRAGSS